MASYQSSADIRVDPALTTRIQSCVLAEANSRADTAYIQAIKLNPMQITSLFVSLMSTDKIMNDAYESSGNTGVTDAMILSGVQTNWDEINKLWQSTQPTARVV